MRLEEEIEQNLLTMFQLPEEWENQPPVARNLYWNEVNTELADALNNLFHEPPTWVSSLSPPALQDYSSTTPLTSEQRQAAARLEERQSANAARDIMDSVANAFQGPVCSVLGPRVRIPGMMTGIKRLCQISRQYREDNINRAHHDELYWYLKQYAFALPRTDALLQQLRQRAIRFLELKKCNHSQRTHTEIIMHVVTQVMILTEQEILLKDAIDRQGFLIAPNRETFANLAIYWGPKALPLIGTALSFVVKDLISAHLHDLSLILSEVEWSLSFPFGVHIG